jgi:hypothetical protein
MNWRVIEVLLAIALVIGAVAYIDHKNELHEQALLAVVRVENQQQAQLVQQLQQANADLTKQIATVQQTAQQAKVQVVQLPPQQLAQQTQQAIGAPAGSVTVTADKPNVEQVTLPAAQEVLRELIQAKADAQTVVDQKAIMANDQKELAAKDAIIKNDAVEIKQLTSEVSRSKRKWFFIGVTVGWIGHTVAKATGVV